MPLGVHRPSHALTRHETAARRPTGHVLCSAKPGYASVQENQRVPRRQWSDLPPRVRAAVQRETGDIRTVEDLAAGSVADIATVLTTAHERIFVKGIDTRTANPHAVRGHRREAALNTLLPAGRVPRLRWEVASEGWLLHGYRYAPGRHADLSPASPDIAPVLVALDDLTHALTPAPAEAAILAQMGRPDPTRRRHRRHPHPHRPDPTKPTRPRRARLGHRLDQPVHRRTLDPVRTTHHQAHPRRPHPSRGRGCC